MSAERVAFLSLGSNVGDRLAHLQAAVAALAAARRTRVLAVSSLYETEPVDYLDQPDFYNAVAVCATRRSPESLLRLCQKIERGRGRERKIPKGPRTLDIDILLYEGECRASPELTLPHPRMRERAFVLVPLREALRMPALAKNAFADSVRKQCARLHPQGGVRKRGAFPAVF